MTETTDRPNSFRMNAEDQYRVARLHEEITSRLEELALIGARVTGAAIGPDAVRKFAPKSSTTFGYDVDIEIICGPYDCGCMYRDDHGQWVWVYPCH